MNGPTASRRKRPRVAEEGRKRAVRACEACRRMKERCQGGHPCERCIRIGQSCEVIELARAAQVLQNENSQSGDSWKTDRIELLERIVAHYTGLARFDIFTLTSFAASLAEHSPQGGQAPLSHCGAVDRIRSPDTVGDAIPLPSFTLDSGELSHSNFSTRVQEKVSNQLQTHQAELPETSSSTYRHPTPSHLQSGSSSIGDAAAAVPPPNVAYFLLDVFIQHGRTNYSYVDEQLLRSKLRGYYSRATPLSISDAPWMATVLMVFAVGTQFAHLSTPLEDNPTQTIDESHADDDKTALAFYHAACKLIPEVMAAATIESVQAFLLLGVFTLPLDAAGLACTYLGIAIKIATQNDLHRQCHKHLESRQIELRKRIWWTTYILERRICILHGRPVSISRAEMNQDLPSTFTGLEVSSKPDMLPNILAMINLTGLLEEARDLIFSMKRRPDRGETPVLSSLLALRQSLRRYWEALPDDTHCKDLRSDHPLFRCNIHLAMTYHLVHIFIGRSFIFEKYATSDSWLDDESSGASIERRNVLVEGCIESALAVLELCRLLDNSKRLARGSYTESSTCCAALLALLACRVNSAENRLESACETGVSFLQKLSVGIYSGNPDKAAVLVLERAVKRLRHAATDESTDQSTMSTYAQFKAWVGEQSQNGSTKSHHGSNHNPNHLPLDVTQFACNDYFSGTILDRSDFEELSNLPGLDDWFELSIK